MEILSSRKERGGHLAENELLDKLSLAGVH